MANRRGSGKGGRKPRPTTLKIASGMRPDRVSITEPKAPPGSPEPPRWLDRHGKEDFRRMSANVAKLGLLSPVDVGGLTVHAVAYSRWRRAGDEIKAALTVEGAHGGLACHAAVGIQERAERTMLAVEGSFGLNPSDRSRLKAVEQTADPFEAFMKESV
jgi:P27 family predicted phage terminase small subunit